jgi:hypothetical protein
MYYSRTFVIGVYFILTATMDIPISSPVIYFTLINPWMVGILMVVLSLIVAKLLFHSSYVTGIRRISVVASLFLVGPTVIILAYMVETPSERLHRLTEEFVDAAISGDQALVDTLLDPDLQIVVGRQTSSLTRDDLTAKLRTLPMLIPSNTVVKCQAGTVGSTSGISEIAQVSQLSIGAPVPNTWRCLWEQDSDGQWVIVELIWVKWGVNDEVPSLQMLRFP